MNTINPNKLHHSKWTAVTPRNKEKHFIVTQLLRDEEENVVDVVLEAVHSHRETTLAWQALKDDSTWKMGWKKRTYHSLPYENKCRKALT